MASSNLAVSGLASGFDWQTLVGQLVTLERAPETQLQVQQGLLGQQNIALGGIKTELSVLQNAVTVLQDPTFFDSRTATPSDTTLASATADVGTTVGTYSFNVTQLASVAAWKGTPAAGGPLSSKDISSEDTDTTGLTLSAAPFARSVTAGTFTVNGKQITIGASDTLKSVFDQISRVTGETVPGEKVTASYSKDSDKITLSSSSAIILGSGADTSNFLQVAKLSSSAATSEGGTVTLASTAKLGSVQTKAALYQANLSAVISDGGSGAGAFTINGVSISFSATSDSLTNVIARINDSGAGVTASYDSANNRLSLTNKTTGDTGISMQDADGSNFLVATGLAGGTLARGKDLLYTVNDGVQLSSRTNTITGESSGISGLSVTALAKDAFTIAVGGDTATIKSAITRFVDAYNQVQATINTETASSTSSAGKVTAGTLAGDQGTISLNSRLRELMNSTVGGMSGTLKRLDNLGFVSNGNDDSLSTTGLSGLDSALATNLSGLKDLFSNASTGLAVQFSSFLEGTIGDSGSLVAHQTTLTTQSVAIDTQISSMEEQILIYQQQLTDSFVAMEVAQSGINQQLAYLTKTFSGSTA
ncbi:MAG: flagellar filament capping protein FliD [Verrucomicrobiota bacterium]